MIGVRKDCVSFRRGKKDTQLSENTWVGSAASVTRFGFAGPPRAAVGPLESSGRWALHGHWRIFLHNLFHVRLMEILDNDPEALRQNLREYFTCMLSSILSTMQSSVAHLPHLFGDDSKTLPVLPLLRSQGGEGFDGERYKYKLGLYEYPDVTSELKKPFLPQVEDILVMRMCQAMELRVKVSKKQLQALRFRACQHIVVLVLCVHLPKKAMGQFKSQLQD